MSASRFIALEGGEGVGKSTQIRLLADALRARGHQVITTREPGGTPGAEALRAMLLDTSGAGWGPRAEALLFAAARADHVARLIRPALDRGDWVLTDRYIDSTRAYQGGGSGLHDSDLMALHRIGSEGLLPDHTVILELEPCVVAERLAVRDRGQSDRIGGRDASYHARVAAAFRGFAGEDPARFVMIDASGTPETVHARVMEALGI